MPEALIVVEPAAHESVWRDVGALVAVTQRLPPRLAIVQGDEGALARLRDVSGIVVVTSGDVPDQLSSGLSESERLFAHGWVLGRSPKQRPGDGLAWDAEGFLPPDRPRSPDQR
jgi:hypothetical protein